MIKLSRVCYAIWSLRPLVSHKSLKMIYFAYFLEVMSYGIIFWGNSPRSITIFKLQKKGHRLITHSRSRDSCRELFKNLDILPFYSQYIFSLLNFVIDNNILLKTNAEVYDVNTRGRNNLYLSQPRLSTYKNGVYYMGIKAFNQLPSFIKDLSDNKNQFKNAFKTTFFWIPFTHSMISLIVNHHFSRCSSMFCILWCFISINVIISLQTWWLYNTKSYMLCQILLCFYFWFDNDPSLYFDTTIPFLTTIF
jgi:hypothetical protein